jgi:hypothetical protein
VENVPAWKALGRNLIAARGACITGGNNNINVTDGAAMTLFACRYESWWERENGIGRGRRIFQWAL